jgi:tryptophan halogenase
LADKLELWRNAGRIEKYSDGLFYDASWIAVYVGQGMLPERHDPRAAMIAPDALARATERLRMAVTGEVATMPGHRDYLRAEAARLAEAA